MRRQKQKPRSSHKSNVQQEQWVAPRERDRPKPISLDQLITIDPLSKNQEDVFTSWDEGYHLALVGSAGTGKTFLAIYMALELVMDKSTPYDSVKILRSIVPVRDPGHLPGTLDDKIEIFNAPYKAICSELFESPTAYGRLVENKYVSFESTSFIRGVTIDNAIIVVDEMQNLNFHELDSVITRVGQDQRN
jgi:predicted ribonuclease YlaK